MLMENIVVQRGDEVTIVLPGGNRLVITAPHAGATLVQLSVMPTDSYRLIVEERKPEDGIPAGIIRIRERYPA